MTRTTGRIQTTHNMNVGHCNNHLRSCAYEICKRVPFLAPPECSSSPLENSLGTPHQVKSSTYAALFHCRRISRRGSGRFPLGPARRAQGGPGLLDRELWRRQQGYGRGGRMKIERDTAHILSGVRHGKTIGSPISVQLENRDWKNWQESLPVGEGDPARHKRVASPRPGHADLAGALKYNFPEARYVLERASARESAARVAIGALAKTFSARARHRSSQPCRRRGQRLFAARKFHGSRFKRSVQAERNPAELRRPRNGAADERRSGQSSEDWRFGGRSF